MSNKKLSISLFTNQLGEYSQSLLDPVVFSNTPNTMNIASISLKQTQALESVRNYYTSNLSAINYKDIPYDEDVYLKLLETIRTMIRLDPKNVTYCLLLEICMKGLKGSLNMYTINERMLSDRETNILLNKQIDEILSNKNLKTTINTVMGKVSFKKTIQLSPLYSDYIHFYGLPKFGDGFDTDKLTFLAKYRL